MNLDERIKAIISAAVVIIVNVAALCGVNLGDGDAITNAALMIASLAATCWAIWKNHNFTDEAAMAQKYLDSLKAERKEM